MPSDEVENLRVHANIVEVGAGLVPFTDVLGGLAGLEEREQVGELGVELGHLGLRVDGREAEQVAVLVVELLLGGGELDRDWERWRWPWSWRWGAGAEAGECGLGATIAYCAYFGVQRIT
jgi:hypothetical protein